MTPFQTCRLFLNDSVLLHLVYVACLAIADEDSWDKASIGRPTNCFCTCNNSYLQEDK